MLSKSPIHCAFDPEDVIIAFECRLQVDKTTICLNKVNVIYARHKLRKWPLDSDRLLVLTTF